MRHELLLPDLGLGEQEIIVMLADFSFTPPEHYAGRHSDAERNTCSHCYSAAAGEPNSDPGHLI